MNKILRLSLLLLFFQSCTPEYQETANGFLYKIDQKGNGEKVTYGNYVDVWFSISTGDSIIFKTTDADGKEAFLRDPAKQRAKVKDPVLDVLPFMSVGDSATVIVEIDELMRMTKDLEDVEKLYYSVVVKGVKTPEEKQKESQASAERRRDQDKKRLLDRTAELQAHPQGGVNYHRLLTTIGDHANNPKLQKTASGLEYIIYKQGSKPFCQEGEQIKVHYIGMQEDRLVFDETYAYNEPFEFVLAKGRVIKAWDEGIQLLGLNGEAFFKVPPKLGYGASGYPPLIQPNSTLYFYIKVSGVTN